MPTDPRPGWEACPTCDGSGGANTCVQCEEPWGDKRSCCGPESWAAFKPCPDCVRGERPGEPLVEAVKSVIGETFIEAMGWGESKPFQALEVYAIARDQARAALLAARREEGDD